MKCLIESEVSPEQVLHDIKQIVDDMLPACNKAQESLKHMNESLDKELIWLETEH